MEKMASFIAVLFTSLVEAYTEEYGEEAQKIAKSIMYDIGALSAWKYLDMYEKEGAEYTIKHYFTESLPPIWEYDISELNEEHAVVRCARCPLADTWKKFGMEESGRLYCDIDYGLASAIPDIKMTRTKSLLDDDPYCEYVIEIEEE